MFRFSNAAVAIAAGLFLTIAPASAQGLFGSLELPKSDRDGRPFGRHGG